MAPKQEQAVIEKNEDLDELLSKTKKFSDEFRKIEKEHNQRLLKLEEQFENLQYFSETSPEQLREELITGIRKLGEKVSDAINKINEKFEAFSKDIYQRIEENEIARESQEQQSEEEKFTELKDNELLDADDFEVVPKEAIENLIDLLKKQSSAVRSLKERHEFQIRDLENRLKSQDKENSESKEVLEQKTSKNLRLVIFAFVLIVIVFILTQIL